MAIKLTPARQALILKLAEGPRKLTKNEKKVVKRLPPFTVNYYGGGLYHLSLIGKALLLEIKGGVKSCQKLQNS